MTGGAAALVAAARALEFSDQAERLEQHEQDLLEPLLLMVVGEGNFGKSSLVNALLGTPVAPVSVVPKTWKVDLYQAGRGAANDEACLYWRSRPLEPERMTRQQALERCIQEEDRLSKGARRSELFQVRWFVRGEWPEPHQSLVVVDTPGFAQVSGATTDDAVRLYGSQGIELAATRPFEYYYYRADVVLWCIKATKLESRETQEAIRDTHHEGKDVLGVITCIDMTPDDDRDAIVERAHELYGAWIPKFVAVTTKSDSEELTTPTVDVLRELLTRRHLSRAADQKRMSAAQFMRRERDEWATRLAGLLGGYRAGFALLEHSSRLADDRVRTAIDATIGAGVLSIDRSASDLLEEFRRLLNSQSTTDDFVAADTATHNDVSAGLQRLTDHLSERVQKDGSQLLADIELHWPTVKLGSATTLVDRTSPIAEPKHWNLPPWKPVPLDINAAEDLLAWITMKLPFESVRDIFGEKVHQIQTKAIVQVYAGYKTQYSDSLRQRQGELSAHLVTGLADSFRVHFGERPDAVATRFAAVGPVLRTLIEATEDIPDAAATSLEGPLAKARVDFESFISDNIVPTCATTIDGTQLPAWAPWRLDYGAAFDLMQQLVRSGNAAATEYLERSLRRFGPSQRVSFILAIPDEARQESAVRTLLSSHEADSLRIALLGAADLGTPSRQLIERSFLSEPYDAQTTPLLLEARDEEVRNHARQLERGVRQQELARALRELESTPLPYPVTDLIGWQQIRDESVTAARNVLAVGCHPSIVLDDERAALESTIARLLGPVSDEARARYAHYLQAVRTRDLVRVRRSLEALSAPSSLGDLSAWRRSRDQAVAAAQSVLAETANDFHADDERGALMSAIEYALGPLSDDAEKRHNDLRQELARQELASACQRLDAITVPSPVIDLPAWRRTRDEAVGSARRALSTTMPSGNEDERVRLESAIQRTMGPTSRQAEDRHNAYGRALTRHQNAKRYWKIVRILSFVAWGLSVLLLGVNAHAAFILWLGSLCTWLIARTQLSKLAETDAWRRFYGDHGDHGDHGDQAALSRAAWYPDALHHHQWRYWDGTSWTSHVADNGHVSSDALPHQPKR